MNLFLGSILGMLVNKTGKQKNKTFEDYSLLAIRRPIRVCHLIPGRIRINAPVLKGKEDSAVQLEKQLKHIDSVLDVKVSALTGSILIYYNKEVLEPALLVAAIIKLLDLESEIDQVPEPLIRKFIKKATKAIDQAVYDRTNGLFDMRTLGFILVTLSGMKKTKLSGSLLTSLVTFFLLTNGSSRREKK